MTTNIITLLIDRVSPLAKKMTALLSLTVVVLSAWVSPSAAFSIIRDAEIEDILNSYGQDLVRAAEIDNSEVTFHLLNDLSFGAFVVQGNRVFVNTGSVIDNDTPSQLAGMLAHEIAHISDRHIEKEIDALKTNKFVSLLSLAVAAGAAVADPGAGLSLLSASTVIPRRLMLSRRRVSEATADRLSFEFLEKVGVSPLGVVEIQKRLLSTRVPLTKFQVYRSTHPPSTERLRRAREELARSPVKSNVDSEEAQLTYDLARAKIYGHSPDYDMIGGRYRSQSPLVPKYEEAIRSARKSDYKAALAKFDVLIAAEPLNPYFHEQKGELLLSMGKSVQALTPLRAALDLADGDNLVAITYARALADAGGAARLEQAEQLLETALSEDAESPAVFRVLAKINFQKGNIGRSNVYEAKGRLMTGDIEGALVLATKVASDNQSGSELRDDAEEVIALVEKATSGTKRRPRRRGG